MARVMMFYAVAWPPCFFFPNSQFTPRGHTLQERSTVHPTTMMMTSPLPVSCTAVGHGDFTRLVYLLFFMAVGTCRTADADFLLSVFDQIQVIWYLSTWLDVHDNTHLRLESSKLQKTLRTSIICLCTRVCMHPRCCWFYSWWPVCFIECPWNSLHPLNLVLCSCLMYACRHAFANTSLLVQNKPPLADFYIPRTTNHMPPQVINLNSSARDRC